MVADSQALDAVYWAAELDRIRDMPSACASEAARGKGAFDLWQDENYCRAELSPIEKASHLKLRKKIYESEHPETAYSARPGRAGKSSQNEINSKPAAAFIDDTAEKTGASRATIAREVRRGEQLGHLAKDIVGTSLDKPAEREQEKSPLRNGQNEPDSETPV